LGGVKAAQSRVSQTYHAFSAVSGTVAAVLVILGVVILAARFLVPRVRATTAPIDYMALILLLIIILTGSRRPWSISPAPAMTT
jgi:nitrate reductase gamma subunit